MLKMKNQLYLFVLLASSNIIISQDKNFATISQNGLSQEKFMTYNVLNYDGDNDRDSYFIEIINGKRIERVGINQAMDVLKILDMGT